MTENGEGGVTVEEARGKRRRSWRLGRVAAALMGGSRDWVDKAIGEKGTERRKDNLRGRWSYEREREGRKEVPIEGRREPELT